MNEEEALYYKIPFARDDIFSISLASAAYGMAFSRLGE
jgi:hypothetical protein